MRNLKRALVLPLVVGATLASGAGVAAAENPEPRSRPAPSGGDGPTAAANIKPLEDKIVVQAGMESSTGSTANTVDSRAAESIASFFTQLR